MEHKCGSNQMQNMGKFLKTISIIQKITMVVNCFINLFVHLRNIYWMPTMCLLEFLVISKRSCLKPTEVEKNFHGRNQVAHRRNRNAGESSLEKKQWPGETRGWSSPCNSQLRSLCGYRCVLYLCVFMLPPQKPVGGCPNYQKVGRWSLLSNHTA